jgi:hypothetical protein
LHLKDSCYGRPPHPICIRRGQLYWPRNARNGRHQFRVVRTLTDGHAQVRRTDGAGQPISVSTVRLLAVDEHGDGNFYRFMGWTPGRYRTWVCAAGYDREGEMLVLVLPEWHPRRPVLVLKQSLPFAVTGPGEWMIATADLSAPYPARLKLAILSPYRDPGRTVCPAPAWRRTEC